MSHGQENYLQVDLSRRIARPRVFASLYGNDKETPFVLGKRKRNCQNEEEDNFIYPKNDINDGVKGFVENTPTTSSNMAKAGAAINLSAIRVEPLGMKRSRGTKNQGELHFPFFLLTDVRTREVYEFYSHISGGKAKEPEGACVTAYRCHDTGSVVIVKALPHDDETNEAARVHRVTQLRAHLKGCMATAHLARVATPPMSGEELGPDHYSVVLMHYAGQPLYSMNLSARSVALSVTRSVARTCGRLYNHGLVYVDIKPANVLYQMIGEESIWLTLCDYGSLAEKGATDAVATYPPPEHPYGTGVHATERALVYGLGMLLVCLFARDQEEQLRFVKNDKKKKRDDKDSVRLADATLGLQTACERVLSHVSALDAGVGEVLRVAMNKDSTLGDLDKAIEHAQLTTDTPNNCERERRENNAPQSSGD
jgi:serine/threonine protein kinase